jgi:hypothetical protein
LAEIKRMSLVKPTLQTRYHIDFDWWGQNERDWRVYLLNYLCSEHQQAFAEMDESVQVDWVDPDTAEVQSVDGLQNILITHCAKQQSFISQHTTLVDSVFRIFLANGNTPLTPEELAEQMGRDSQTVLKTLSGPRVYKGLRPVLE